MRHVINCLATCFKTYQYVTGVMFLVAPLQALTRRDHLTHSPPIEGTACRRLQLPTLSYDGALRGNDCAEQKPPREVAYAQRSLSDRRDSGRMRIGISPICWTEVAITSSRTTFSAARIYRWSFSHWYVSEHAAAAVKRHDCFSFDRSK